LTTLALVSIEFIMKPPRNFQPHPFSYHQEIELRIDDLTNLGQGVGRIDGWVIFVPFALPGEKVLARIWRNKKQYSDADLVEILEASPDRQEPVCPLFQECGGCQYQHLSYKAQLEWKSKQITQLLEKMAGLKTAVNNCLGRKDRTFGYRSKITPHFRRPPHIPDTAIGFQRFSSRSIIDIESCPIASETINQALPVERQRLRDRGDSYRRGGTLLLRDSEGGVITDMKAIATEKVGDHVFEFVAGEFFQNNPHVLPLMVDYALDKAAGEGIEYLVDAYCGVGVFGICGHDRFQSVAGIEVSERAVELAQSNASRNKLQNLSFHLGQAEAIFQQIDFPPDKTTVLLDPPRKGCDPDFIRQLLDFGPRRIVYVSCGPDTQARDVSMLAETAYMVTDVQPVDLFPQTRHIESIITLERGELASPVPL